MTQLASQSVQGVENLYLIPEGQLNKADIQSWVCSWVAKTIAVDLDLVSPTVSFLSYGLTSVELAQLLSAVEESTGVHVGNSVFWELENISNLSEHICGIAINPEDQFLS